MYDEKQNAVFLGERAIEPQLGPWPIGGKLTYGRSPQESAAKHIERDFGLKVDPGLIYELGTVSTPFPIAGPQEGFDTIGRHTVDTICFVGLKPDEVAQLNRKVTSGDISEENSGGKWVKVEEIRDPDSSYPDAVKEEMRMLRSWLDSLDQARRQAPREDLLRTIGRMTGTKLFMTPTEKRHQERIGEIRRQLDEKGISNDTVPVIDGEKEYALQDDLVRISSVYSLDAVDWLSDAIASVENGGTRIESWAELEGRLSAMLYEKTPEGLRKDSTKYGDYHRRKLLAELRLPSVDAPDNGIKQRAVLKGAQTLLHAINNGGAAGDQLLQRL